MNQLRSEMTIFRKCKTKDLFVSYSSFQKEQKEMNEGGRSKSRTKIQSSVDVS